MLLRAARAGGITVERLLGGQLSVAGRCPLALIERVKLEPVVLAVVLLTAQSYTMPEVAARLRIPVNTAWTHLRRARVKYKRAMSRG